MTTVEKVEITLIGVFILLIVSAFSSLLPSNMKLGTLLLYCSALLLFQGLLRDLYHYFSQNNVDDSPVTYAQCVCLESSIGVIGIFAGFIVTFTPIDAVIVLSSLNWALILSFVVAVGFLLKDWVFHWQPMGFKREKNHMNVIFVLKK